MSIQVHSLSELLLVWGRWTPVEKSGSTKQEASPVTHQRSRENVARIAAGEPPDLAPLSVVDGRPTFEHVAGPRLRWCDESKGAGA